MNFDIKVCQQTNSDIMDLNQELAINGQTMDVTFKELKMV